MAINLGLNIKTNTKSSHTVNIVASSGITLATVNSSTKRLTGSATEDVIKEILLLLMIIFIIQKLLILNLILTMEI